MAEFTTFIEQFSDILWNSLLLFLLVGTGIYFYRAAAGRSDTPLWRGRAPGVRRLYPARQKSGRRRYEQLSGADHGHCGTGRHRQHHRLRHGAGQRRPGRAILDVGVGVFRHGHHLCRGRAGAALQNHGERSCHRRARVLHPRRVQGPGRQGSGHRVFGAHHSGAGLYGQYGAVQLHRRCVFQRLRHEPAGGWTDYRGHCGLHLSGRRAENRRRHRKKLCPLWRRFYIVGCVIILALNFKALPNALAQIFLCWRSSRRQWPAAWPV